MSLQINSESLRELGINGNLKHKTALSTPRQYVQFWLGRQAALNSNIIELIKSPHIESTLFLDYLDDINAYKQAHFRIAKLNKTAPDAEKHPQNAKLTEYKKAVILDAYYEILPDIYKLITNQIIAQIENSKCTRNVPETLERWLSALTGVSDPRHLAVMSHWCWQVKRKALGKAVVWPVFPVFKGPQGSGKTKAIQRLISPFQHLIMDLSVTSVVDERNYQSLSENLIAFLDELHGAGRSDINGLKRVVTADNLNARRLYSHTNSNISVKVSFIGATNISLAKQIYDTTGARRYYQIDCSLRANREIINSIDYIELWRQIDETLPEGYLTGDILDAVLAEQAAKLTPEDPILTFFNDCVILPEKGVKTKTVSLSVLHLAYRHWFLTANGSAPKVRRTDFAKDLEEFGLQSTIRLDKTKKVIEFEVNADADLSVLGEK